MKRRRRVNFSVLHSDSIIQLHSEAVVLFDFSQLSHDFALNAHIGWSLKRISKREGLRLLVEIIDTMRAPAVAKSNVSPLMHLVQVFHHEQEATEEL